MSIFPAGYVTVEEKQQQKSKGKTTTKAYNQNYFDSRQLVWRPEDKKENITGLQEEATFIMCGFFNTDHFIAGKSYWTHEPPVHKKFHWQQGAPSNWRDEIALNFNAKKTKIEYGNHNPKEDLDYPKDFISFVAYFPCSPASSKKPINKLEKYPDLQTEGSFKIVTIDRNDLRGKLESILKMDESYFQTESGIWNFKIVLKRTSNTDAELTPAPMPKIPASLLKAWEEQKGQIWVPALFDQGDPFLGKPAEAKNCGLPPSVRDDFGADQEIAVTSTTDIGDDWT